MKQQAQNVRKKGIQKKEQQTKLLHFPTSRHKYYWMIKMQKVCITWIQRKGKSSTWFIHGPKIMWSMTLQKIPQFHVTSWCGNYVERSSFCIVLGTSPETMGKLFLSTKFPHQEITWNDGIFRRVMDITLNQCTYFFQVLEVQINLICWKWYTTLYQKHCFITVNTQKKPRVFYLDLQKYQQ